jgi:hypothetical protein
VLFTALRPWAPLICPGCGNGMQAMVSRRGLRSFAYDPGSPTCGLAGEPMEHCFLKLEFVLTARNADWHAEMEVPASDWRWQWADVLATAGRLPTEALKASHDCLPA